MQRSKPHLAHYALAKAGFDDYLVAIRISIGFVGKISRIQGLTRVGVIGMFAPTFKDKP